MTTRVDLGARRSAIVYCWVFRDNYIQQLLKRKDDIGRSYEKELVSPDKQYWVFIIRNNKRPYFYFA